MDIRFEWDERKAASNMQKHTVTFEEAITVFLDPSAITVFDTSHSDAEDRYLDIGRSDKQRLLVVSYTERPGVIRIISCRKAAASERRQYEQRTPES